MFEVYCVVSGTTLWLYSDKSVFFLLSISVSLGQFVAPAINVFLSLSQKKTFAKKLLLVTKKLLPTYAFAPFDDDRAYLSLIHICVLHSTNHIDWHEKPNSLVNQQVYDFRMLCGKVFILKFLFRIQKSIEHHI